MKTKIGASYQNLIKKKNNQKTEDVLILDESKLKDYDKNWISLLRNSLVLKVDFQL